jgi:hypothetical protein
MPPEARSPPGDQKTAGRHKALIFQWLQPPFVAARKKGVGGRHKALIFRGFKPPTTTTVLRTASRFRAASPSDAKPVSAAQQEACTGASDVALWVKRGAQETIHQCVRCGFDGCERVPPRQTCPPSDGHPRSSAAHSRAAEFVMAGGVGREIMYGVTTGRTSRSDGGADPTGDKS